MQNEGKQKLVIGGLFGMDMIRGSVLSFNNASEDFYIEIKDYSTLYEEVEDARNARAFPRQSPADDHRRISLRVLTARIFGEQPLIGCKQSVEQIRDPHLTAVCMTAQDKIKRDVFVFRLKIFRSV